MGTFPKGNKRKNDSGFCPWEARLQAYDLGCDDIGV